MNGDTKELGQLRERLGEILGYSTRRRGAGVGQLTNMPPGGAAARAEQLATLQKTAHTWFTSDAVGQLLETCRGLAAGWDYDSDAASLARVTTRDYEKARKVPPALVAELARVSALAYEAWAKARSTSDFPLFRPHLERIVDLNIQIAEALGYQERIYDALLDQYEPDMKTAQVAALFDELKAELVPMVRTIGGQAEPVDDAVLRRPLGVDQQWNFGVAVLHDIGFDFERGRQDRSVHPFTTSFSINDVRLTTRLDPDYFPQALFGTIHEGGHGLYEQGVAPELERTGLDDGASLGIHESQSRLWENLVARSRPFWQHYLPRLQQVFAGQMDDMDVETLYRAINRVKPSFIRVEADEVTYNLHIMLRFELENDMLEGRVRIADLPEAWNAKMHDYLGVVPTTDALGVLQDVHWSGGMLGYFPTYALGNLYSVQILDQARQDIPNLDDLNARGEFGVLLTWLRDRIHRHGRKYAPAELVRRVTGNDLSASNYLTYVKSKFGEIYGL